MRQPDQKTNLIDLLIPLVVLGLLTFGIGSYGLYEPHETHFALVGSEMVWRNDWITPHLNGAPYLNKPPLLYWLIALSQTIFGQTEFAARLPIAIAAWLGAIIAGIWSKDLWGTVAYRGTCLMLGATLGWFIFSHQILIDVLLGTLLLTSNYFLWRLLHRPRYWLNFVGFYGGVALVFLAKGLIGIAIIAVTYVAIALLNSPLRFWRQTRLPLGIIFTGALILPWCLAIEKANPGFWHYFLFNEHLARILDKRIPPDYVVSQTSILGYLGFTALWCFPWSLFFPSVIYFIWQKFNPGNLKVDRTDSSDRNAIVLLTLGLTLPIAIFLPLKSRLIYYSIPAIPSYILLLSGVFSSLLQAEEILDYGQRLKLQKSFRLGFSLYGTILSILGMLCLAAIALFPRLIESLPNIPLHSSLTGLALAVVLILALGSLFTGIELLKSNYHSAFIGLLVGLFALYSVIPLGFGIYQDLRSSKKLVTLARGVLPNSTLWVFEGSREIGAAAGLSYYLNQGIANFKFDSVATEQKFEEAPGLVAGKDNTYYLNVLVLEDGGANRLPPQFPGAKPDYLKNKQQLQIYWESDRPAIFITDFLRDPNDPQDPIMANLPEPAQEITFNGSNKKLYINQAAANYLRRKKLRF